MKRFPALLGIVVLILALGVGLGVRETFQKLREKGNTVAVVPVRGTLLDVSETLKWLRRLLEIKPRAVLIEIESPGGAVGPSQELVWAVRRLKDSLKIPVVAYIPSLGASGAYYVASQADAIVALPGALVGSIGVIAQFPDVSELGKKVGVRMQVLKAGALKDAGTPWRPLSPRARDYFERLLQDVHAQFIQDVQQGRHLPLDSLTALADGRVFTGAQAARLGLVDTLGDRQVALELLKTRAGIRGKPRLMYPPPPRKPLLKRLISESVGDLSAAWLPSRPGVYFLWTGPD